MVDEQPIALDYRVVINDFALRWHAAGLAVPRDYANTNARPSSRDSRRYQLQRGPGDGRMVDAITPSNERWHSVDVGHLACLVFHHDEAELRAPNNALLLPTATFLGHMTGTLVAPPVTPSH